MELEQAQQLAILIARYNKVEHALDWATNNLNGYSGDVVLANWKEGRDFYDLAIASYAAAMRQAVDALTTEVADLLTKIAEFQLPSNPSVKPLYIVPPEALGLINGLLWEWSMRRCRSASDAQAVAKMLGLTPPLQAAHGYVLGDDLEGQIKAIKALANACDMVLKTITVEGAALKQELQQPAEGGTTL